MIENFNKTLGALLRQVTSDHQRDWDKHVELATMAYRSTVHESTGQTPNKMMLGRELPMPSHLLVATPDRRNVTGKIPFVQDLHDKLLEAHTLAREHLKKNHIHQKQQYDRTTRRTEWEVGTAVWLYNPTKQVGKSPKLTIFWEEMPYVITEKINPVVMKIQKSRASKPKIIHIDRLKRVEGPIDISWYTGTNPKTEREKENKPSRVIAKPAEKTIMEEMGLSHM